MGPGGVTISNSIALTHPALIVFQVGCGGGGGWVTVTDDDQIEKSNLSRQFLFRNKDVGQPKSGTAAAAAKAMNPSFNIKPMQERCGRPVATLPSIILPDCGVCGGGGGQRA